MTVLTPTHPRRAVRLSAVVLALAAALASCKKEAAPEPDATTPQAAAQQAAPQPAVSDAVAAMSPDQLREAASAALREQRLYAPAGNNAMEYYLALRDKTPNEPAVASALTDLMPYALIATEQSIGREDLAEAQRLYALMEKTDPQAPALPRLKQAIAAQQQVVAQRSEQERLRAEEDARRQTELERQRQQQQQQTQQQAAQQLAAQREAEQRAATQREAEQRAAAQREQEQREAAQRAQTAPTQAAAAPAALRAVSTPAPDYPPDALREGRSGEVQVEFTVGADGAVTSARVVRSNPPRVFDRAALNAVRRWRFQPVGAPVTTRRTIAFNPGS
jgi:protein TonB